MDEQLKDRVLIAMAIITVICLIVAISSSIAVQKNKRSLHREMVLRMDIEEKLINVTPKVDVLENELRNTKANLEGATKTIKDLKTINAELRNELEKVNKLKETLEENLKDALVGSRR